MVPGYLIINGNQVLPAQVPWTDISVNGTNSTYDVPSATSGSYFYRVIVTDVASGCSDPVSNVINVIISQDLAVTSEPANITECIGGTAQMTVVVSGGSGTISYQWQSSPDGSNPWVNATGYRFYHSNVYTAEHRCRINLLSCINQCHG
jgi:hypothetical protein